MMKDFLLENYQWMITLLCSVLSILIFIFKKVKVIKKDTSFEALLSILPSMIIQAEKTFSKGSEKKAFVMALSIEFLKKVTGEDDAEKLTEEYQKRIDDAIEAILLTPMKKG